MKRDALIGKFHRLICRIGRDLFHCRTPFPFSREIMPP
jgi:hypothetical protein